MPKRSKYQCFVIMPFSETSKDHTEDYWTNHFETFLKPNIDKIPKITAHRSEPLRGDIIKQIIRDLVTAKVVVADLTDHNPNVFWELGVRQSFKHNTITIAEIGTKLPFDISNKSTLFYYPKDHIKNAKFLENFSKAINDCIKNPNIPDSHVLESVTGRGSLYEIIKYEEIIRKLDGLFSELNDNINDFENMHKWIIDDKSIPTSRFRTSSVKLLITDRYLDEDEDFYDNIISYYDVLRVLNGQLKVIDLDQDSVNDYLKGRKEEDKKFFKETQILVEEASYTFLRKKI